MGIVKNKSIKSLLEGIDCYETSRKRIGRENLNGIKNLYDQFLAANSKPERDQLVSEFKKRNEEFAEFIQSNPELIETELQKSLLLAASGGEYTEEEITVDSKGRKKVKHTKKTALPDVSAAKELKSMLGSSESTESSIASAWINALMEDENAPEK